MMKPCSNVPFFSLPLIQVIEMLNFLSFVQCVWMGELACMWVWVVVVVLCVFLCVCVCGRGGEREHFPNYEQCVGVRFYVCERERAFSKL